MLKTATFSEAESVTKSADKFSVNKIDDLGVSTTHFHPEVMLGDASDQPGDDSGHPSNIQEPETEMVIHYTRNLNNITRPPCEGCESG